MPVSIAEFAREFQAKNDSELHLTPGADREKWFVMPATVTVKGQIVRETARFLRLAVSWGIFGLDLACFAAWGGLGDIDSRSRTPEIRKAGSNCVAAFLHCLS